MLDPAFEALKTYNWGGDLNALRPIDQAVVATADDAVARQALERRLTEMLQQDLSRAAKDFLCRQLRAIGTATSVRALGQLLPHKEYSHMARYALERIPAAEAAQAMREALAAVDDQLKVGLISSLGSRQDTASVPALGKLLSDANEAVARAAAMALGTIRTGEAAAALRQAKPKNPQTRLAITDALLACAEAILAAGRNSEAAAIYQDLANEDQPKHVRLAATRGRLACAAVNNQ